MSFQPQIIQYAWVVPDLATAARRWHATTGIGPFLVNRDLRLDQPRYRGAPSVTRFSTAVAQHGDIQIELVEQLDDTASAYRDTVAPGRTGFHHVAFIAGRQVQPGHRQCEKEGDERGPCGFLENAGEVDAGHARPCSRRFRHQTFSTSGLPSSPVGRKRRTRIRIPKAATSLYSTEK